MQTEIAVRIPMNIPQNLRKDGGKIEGRRQNISEGTSSEWFDC